MRRLWLAAWACAALAGCGAEAVGSAATGAVVKQRELDAGQAAQQRAREQLQQGLDLGQQRTQQADDAGR